MHFTRPRRECLPGVPNAGAVLAFPIICEMVFLLATFGISMVVVLWLIAGGQPLWQVLLGAKLLLGSFAAFIVRIRR